MMLESANSPLTAVMDNQKLQPFNCCLWDDHLFFQLICALLGCQDLTPALVLDYKFEIIDYEEHLKKKSD